MIQYLRYIDPTPINLHKGRYSKVRNAVRSIPRMEVARIHKDLDGPIHPDVTRIEYLRVFVDGATRDKCVRGLETLGEVINATAEYIDEMVRKGTVIECISGDRAGRFKDPSSFSAC